MLPPHVLSVLLEVPGQQLFDLGLFVPGCDGCEGFIEIVVRIDRTRPLNPPYRLAARSITLLLQRNSKV